MWSPCPATTSIAEEREREFLLRMETAKKYLEKQDYRRVLQYLKIARGVTGYERDPDAVAMWDRLATPFPNKHLNTAWEMATDEDVSDAVLAVGISSTGLFALSGGRDKILRIWDVKDGRCLLSLEGHTGPITAVASVGPGKFVISGSRDRTLRLWNLETRTCIRALMEHRDEVTCVAASPDGRYAALRRPGQSDFIMGSFKRNLHQGIQRPHRCRDFRGLQSGRDIYRFGRK